MSHLKNLSQPPIQKPNVMLDKMQSSAALPRITESFSPNKQFTSKFRNYKGAESLGNLNQDMTKSMSPRKLPPISPKLNEIPWLPFASNQIKMQSEEVINLDKFVIKTIKKPEFKKNNKNEPSIDESLLKVAKKKKHFW